MLYSDILIPSWCNYHEPTAGEMGCWSLISGYLTKEHSCKGCPECVTSRWNQKEADNIVANQTLLFNYINTIVTLKANIDTIIKLVILTKEIGLYLYQNNLWVETEPLMEYYFDLTNRIDYLAKITGVGDEAMQYGKYRLPLEFIGKEDPCIPDYYEKIATKYLATKTAS